MRVLLKEPFQEMLSVGSDRSDEIAVARTRTVKWGGFALLSTALTGVTRARAALLAPCCVTGQPRAGRGEQTRVFPSCDTAVCKR